MSPLWWLEKLHGELSARQEQMALMDRYYLGDHPLPFLTKAHESKMRDEFRLLLEDSRSNFMRLVVDVVEERLRVEGFRLSASTDPVADRGAWDIWQANQMDSESQTAFVESLVKGVSYLSVWAGARGDDFPVIAVEDPTQTIVGYEPGSNFRRRAAALKVWRDDWAGKDRANVYLPQGIYKFEAKASTEQVATRSGSEAQFGGVTSPVARSEQRAAARWKPLDDPQEAAFLANPVGVVPIVALRNRPRLLAEGESEIADVYRVQNQINGFLFLLALAGYFGAHRQRWAVGITIMEDPNTGKPKEPWRAAIDDIWVSTNPNAQLGEFGQTDLSGYISAVEQKVLHIAVTTRTPRHYLIEQGQSPSGDAIKSAESGLVKKVQRKMRPFGESLEEVIGLARRFQGETDTPVDSEIVWANPEIRTEAEITDATIKKYQARLISWEQALEDVGYTPQKIARMKQQRADDPTSFAPEATASADVAVPVQ